MSHWVLALHGTLLISGACTIGVAPSQHVSDHQEFYIFSRGSLYTFIYIMLLGRGPHPTYRTSSARQVALNILHLCSFLREKFWKWQLGQDVKVILFFCMFKAVNEGLVVFCFLWIVTGIQACIQMYTGVSCIPCTRFHNMFHFDVSTAMTH